MKEKLFATRFEEYCDIQDPKYPAWVKINHPECCLSAASNSSVSASSDVNHKSSTSKTNATTPPKSGAMVSGTEATTSSEPLKSTASESDLSDILVLPKLKEKSGRKRKPGINQKLFVLQMMLCLIDLKLKTKKRRIKNWKNVKEKSRGEIKKEIRTKKKQKAKAKKAKQPVEDLETVLEGLTLAQLEMMQLKMKQFAPSVANCTLQIQKTSYGSAMTSVTNGCTKLRSKKRLPDTYICDLCK